VPLARLTGIVVGGWLLTRSAVRAEAEASGTTGDGDFFAGKLQAARFYASQVLPQAHALSRLVLQGAATVVDADPARI